MYKLPENLVFHGELGHNYLAIKDFILDGRIPLLGPPTSHPWLSFGPLFYWIMAPVMILFDFNPVAPAYFFAFASSLTVILNLYVIKKIIGWQVALVSSLLMTISPAFIKIAWESRFFSLIIPIFYVFIYFFQKVLKTNKGYTSLGVIFGVLLNFHYTPLVLLPVILFYLVVAKNVNRFLNFFRFTSGVVLTLTPLVLYDLLNKFEMLGKLVLWVPYRLAGFLGVYPKNNVSSDSLISTFNTLFKFLGETVLPPNNNFTLVFGVMIFIAIIYYFKKSSFLGLIFLVGVVSLFIHGDPPTHYLFLLLPAILMFVSLATVESFKKFPLLTILVVFLVLLKNGTYYHSDWFKSRTVNTNVSYKIQLEAVESIIKNSEGQNFAIKRVGPGDEFEGNYAQNYEYLLWRLRSAPVKASDTVYTFVEFENKYKGEVVFDSEELTVYKNEN